MSTTCRPRPPATTSRNRKVRGINRLRFITAVHVSLAICKYERDVAGSNGAAADEIRGEERARDESNRANLPLPHERFSRPNLAPADGTRLIRAPFAPPSPALSAATRVRSMRLTSWRGLAWAVLSLVSTATSRASARLACSTVRRSSKQARKPTPCQTRRLWRGVAHAPLRSPRKRTPYGGRSASAVAISTAPEQSARLPVTMHSHALANGFLRPRRGGFAARDRPTQWRSHPGRGDAIPAIGCVRRS